MVKLQDNTQVQQPQTNPTPESPAETPVMIPAEFSQQPALTSPVTNTSGQGGSTIVPGEVKGWSWGGFFMTWIWGIFNGVWISLVALVIPWPIMNIVLGIKGGEWAWQSKKWDSIEHFQKVQRNWAIAGLIILMLVILGFALYVSECSKTNSCSL